MPDVNMDMLALSIQQPWAELILRGIKTIEIRRVPARPQQIYLYASQRFSTISLLKCEEEGGEICRERLPRGMIVGTVEILACRRAVAEDAVAAVIPPSYLADQYSWILGNPVRLSQPLAPRFVPFGTWFYPFKRVRTNRRKRRDHGGLSPDCISSLWNGGAGRS